MSSSFAWFRDRFARARQASAFVAVTILLTSCAGTPSDSQRGNERFGLDFGCEAQCFHGTRPVSFDTMIDDLSRRGVVVVGEKHDDALTHRLELAILRGIGERRAATASFEMFERHEQAAIDEYLRGNIDEATFLSRIDPWKNYVEAYRPILEHCRERGFPVIAANGERKLLRKVSKARSFDGLSDDERSMLPSDLYPAEDAYWQRYDRISRAHGREPGPPTMERLYWTQNLWDNCMADAIVRGHIDDPLRCIVHYVGEFHSAFGNGTVHQIRVRDPGIDVATVSIEPTFGVRAVDARSDADRADYVVYVEHRARDRFRSDGDYGVTIPSSMPWRLVHNPSTEALPLLIWLPDAGVAPQDDLPWLQTTLGSGTRIAVLGGPRLVHGRHGAIQGWYEQLEGSTGGIRQGIEEVLRYLSERVPIAGDRIVVAGEGQGAAVALAIARTARALSWSTVAIEPKDLDDVAMSGTASPPLVDARRSLTVMLAKPKVYAALAVLDHEIGIETAVVDAPSDPEGASITHALSSALGIVSAKPDTNVVTSERSLITRPLEGDPRRRSWTRSYLARIAREHPEVATTVVSTPGAAKAGTEMFVLDYGPLRIDENEIAPALSIAELFGRVPKSTDPFGGTTVLVMPEQTDDQERAAWQALALREAKLGRQVRIATGGDDGDVNDVLRSLPESRSVLIVPAEFCASAERLEDLRRRIARDDTLADRDIAYRRGLGAPSK
ncbi:MAG: ChaN family lipoprotein [Planctomycetes bacterium]|nr:ChaN family lipoprotein [Planctomycetota bacterium]